MTDMKRRVVFSCAVAVAVFTAQAAAPIERRVTLVDFTRPENCQAARLNAWGGDKQGRAFHDPAAGCLRLVYTNSHATFLSPVLARALTKLLANGTKAEVPAMYSFVYRVRRLEGGSQIHFNTTETYVSEIGFRRDGGKHEVSLRPGGWNRNGTPFDPAALTSLYIALSGSGDLELYEIGAVYRTYPGTRPDPTPLDVDAVAVFPEPKLFTEDGAPMPLARFAAPKAFGFGTAYAADWFARELRAFYGASAFAAADGLPVTFALEDTPEAKAALEVCGKGKDLARVKATGRIVHDGFLVLVGDGGIVVLGREPMGVMNGVRTLASLVKQHSGDVGPGCVRPLTLLDWPRLRNRMLHQTMSCYYHANRYEPDDYADKLEKFALDARMNLLSFELMEYYRYESAPGTGVPPQSWGRQEFTRLVDRVNAAGAKVVPFVQSPGHQALGLFGNKTVRLDLREDGCNDVMCTRHPDSYPFLFGVFDEVVGICEHNPGYKADVFYAGVDEVRWKAVPPEKRCRYCRDVPYNRLLTDHIEKVDGWLRNRGYRMLMCSDMFVDNHNGMNRFKCSETRTRIPKDVAFAHWGSMDFEVMDAWAAEGYDNWKLLTGFQDDPIGEEVVKGYGLALYNYNWWLSRTRAMDQGNYGLMAIRLAAANAWGRAPTVAGEWEARLARWGNHLMRNWSRKPIPHGTDSFAPVALAAAANAPLAGSLDCSVRSLAGVPVSFAQDASGARVGLVATSNAVPVALGRKAASLVFLHTAELPDARKKDFYNRANYHDEAEGPKVVTWTVAYADGTQATFDVRFGWNVGAWNDGLARCARFERFVTDARFAWTAPNGDTAYLHEWVNPHPEKEIVSVTLGTAHPRLVYTLLALTARQTDL